MVTTVYDVTTFNGSVSPYTDIGKVINEIIADIKSNQTTQDTRPGAVIYIPPGHYDLLTRVVIDISFLTIKGSGHGFLSRAIHDDTSDTSNWFEVQPGSSHIRVKHTDGTDEAFLVRRSGAPAEVGRLNGIVFQDFCIDGVASTKPYVEGNHKIGISVQSDNDSFRFEGMGFVYLTQAMVVKGADACSFTNNFVAECGTSISLPGASQVAKITNNYLISAWAGYSVFAENAEGILISGNTILWACNITLINSNRCTVSANKLLSNFPSMIALTNGSSENLISGNHFRRVYGDGTSTRFDDLFGLVHINGDDNSVTANQFSFSVPAAGISPAGADPTLILVAGGARNYLATNKIKANLGVKVVLDSSSTDTKILYSAAESQLRAHTNDYKLVATP
ncbi:MULTISPECIES: NosD domain-containing protein [Streptomyces]|uniref:Inulin fructotransferase [DFA-I-forming] n=1 Tax=Streptomyces chartreusis NRRL 3882 TaxID=1079985 RepID=A0A2N9B0A9_STRCX|nr:NosD domain-containing protein [Streptomyces chartreusis]MYS91046.1 right-handed parallel beta-helix repeat-containing protein [Streptomyces sp. SID5464]SOR76744.1 Inulin fructotransferase [DFA-I-forming] [Streptomyces chartreusis NRRL 3882]